MGKEKVTVNDLKVTLSELGVTSGLKQEKIIQRLQVNGCLIAMVTDVLDQLIKDEEFKDFDKYDKLHIGKTFEMLIDTNTIKKKLNNGTMKFVPFSHVLFKNGYYDDSPKVEKEIESITIGKPKKGLCPGKWLDHEFFIIKFK